MTLEEFLMYTGTDIDISKDKAHGVSGAIVKKLMKKYLEKGLILYTDDWYTSPNLSAYLLVHKSGTCGTVKKVCKHFPLFGFMPKR